MEALTSEKTNAEVARTYDIYPVTLSKWKKGFKENGQKVFGMGVELKKTDDKVAKFERMVAKHVKYSAQGSRGDAAEQCAGGNCRPTLPPR